MDPVPIWALTLALTPSFSIERSVCVLHLAAEVQRFRSDNNLPTFDCSDLSFQFSFTCLGSRPDVRVERGSLDQILLSSEVMGACWPGTCLCLVGWSVYTHNFSIAGQFLFHKLWASSFIHSDTLDCLLWCSQTLFAFTLSLPITPIITLMALVFPANPFFLLDAQIMSVKFALVKKQWLYITS